MRSSHYANEHTTREKERKKKRKTKIERGPIYLIVPAPYLSLIYKNNNKNKHAHNTNKHIGPLSITQTAHQKREEQRRRHKTAFPTHPLSKFLLPILLTNLGQNPS